MHGAPEVYELDKTRTWQSVDFFFRFLVSQVKQLGELGLMGVAISEENGGTGLDYLVSNYLMCGQLATRCGRVSFGIRHACRQGSSTTILHIYCDCKSEVARSTIVVLKLKMLVAYCCMVPWRFFFREKKLVDDAFCYY